MKKNILKIMLGSIILEVILVCLFILLGSFDEVTAKSLCSVGIIFGYAIPCLFYSKIYDNEQYKSIAISGACTAGTLALISILSLWDLIGQDDFFKKIISTLNIIVWMLAAISWILSYISTNNLFNSFKKITISSISLLSFLTTVILWTEKSPENFAARLYYILIVLTGGSFICTLILTRIYKNEIIKSSQNEKNTQAISNTNFVTQDNNQIQTKKSIETNQTTSSDSEEILDNNDSNNI